MAEESSLKGRYEKMATTRDPYVTRARQLASLTIPALFPEEGQDGYTTFHTPYQSVGAHGINVLTSKLMNVLFPPQTMASFFRLKIDANVLKKVAQSEDQLGLAEEALAKAERTILNKLESADIRPALFEALKLMLISNVLLRRMPDGQFKLFRADKWVCKRGPTGAMLRIITKESVSLLEINEKTVQALGLGAGVDDTLDTLDVFTQAQRDRQGNWAITQEIDGKQVPGMQTEPADRFSWLVLAPALLPGEDYARSFVEEYIGDLVTLEALEKALTQGAAALAKLVFLVRPNATTSVRDLNIAESGEFVVGMPDDVAMLALDKARDFTFVAARAEHIERRLSHAFLLSSAVQRQAERVTAEEIRYMSQELEATMGGMYPTLAAAIQKPLVRMQLAALQDQGVLPYLPENLVDIQITTGVDGLGRQADLAKYDVLRDDMKEFGPPGMEYLNMGEFFGRRCTNLGIDRVGLVYTQDEVEQQRQKNLQMQMALQTAPVAAEAAVNTGGQ